MSGEAAEGQRTFAVWCGLNAAHPVQNELVVRPWDSLPVLMTSTTRTLGLRLVSLAAKSLTAAATTTAG